MTHLHTDFFQLVFPNSPISLTLYRKCYRRISNIYLTQTSIFRLITNLEPLFNNFGKTILIISPRLAA